MDQLEDCKFWYPSKHSNSELSLVQNVSLIVFGGINGIDLAKLLLVVHYFIFISFIQVASFIVVIPIILWSFTRCFASC